MSDIVEKVISKVRGRPRKYSFPSKLVCTVTGKVVKTNPTQCKKQIEKSGLSQEDFINTYVCQKARSEIAKGFLVKDSDGNWIRIETNPEPIQRSKKLEPILEPPQSSEPQFEEGPVMPIPSFAVQDVTASKEWPDIYTTDESDENTSESE